MVFTLISHLAALLIVLYFLSIVMPTLQSARAESIRVETILHKPAERSDSAASRLAGEQAMKVILGALTSSAYVLELVDLNDHRIVFGDRESPNPIYCGFYYELCVVDGADGGCMVAVGIRLKRGIVDLRTERRLRQCMVWIQSVLWLAETAPTGTASTSG